MGVDLKAIRNRIISRLDGLEARQLAAVESVVRNMHRKVDFRPGNTTELVGDAFREEMALFLVAHHALHERALNKENFEYIFKQCLIASGDADARLNPNQKQAKFDVEGGGYTWSLKTETGDSMSKNQVKVEKFTEALWIRDSLTAEDCARNVRELVIPRLSDYERIVVLRASRAGAFITYSLEEIPWMLLSSSLVSQTRPEIFSKAQRGKKVAKSFGADYLGADGGTRQFRMLLDTSVEKVRIWFALRECVHHGYWTLPGSAATDVLQFSTAAAAEIPRQPDQHQQTSATYQEEFPI
ncbi:hypothetical protein OG432_16195 [Streptomyces sp. NBC_00442]|uniref:hypothetical protein n=1 Tax=Streptomyces sp. NBC_00442 TaxID=2903651 RepID=UPI002E21018C